MQLDWCSWFWWCLGPPEQDFLPSTSWCFKHWASQGGPWQILKFQAFGQEPNKWERVSPRLPTDSKMTPKTYPLDTKLLNKSKTWNHSKHMVFTMVMAHAAIPFWHHSHPWTTKNMDLETVCHFATLNHRKFEKSVQSRSRGAPQIRSKIDENQYLSPSVSIGCPCGTQESRNGVPGTQKGVSRSPKS